MASRKKIDATVLPNQKCPFCGEPNTTITMYPDGMIYVDCPACTEQRSYKLDRDADGRTVRITPGAKKAE